MKTKTEIQDDHFNNIVEQAHPGSQAWAMEYFYSLIGNYQGLIKRLMNAYPYPNLPEKVDDELKAELLDIAKNGGNNCSVRSKTILGGHQQLRIGAEPGKPLKENFRFFVFHEDKTYFVDLTDSSCKLIENGLVFYFLEVSMEVLREINKVIE